MIRFKAKNAMKFVGKPNTTEANRPPQTATKQETNKQKNLLFTPMQQQY